MSAAIVKKLQWSKQNIVNLKKTLQQLLDKTERDDQLILNFWEQFEPSLNEFQKIVSELFDQEVDISGEIGPFQMEYFKIKCAVDLIRPKIQNNMQCNGGGSPPARAPPAQLPVVNLPIFSGNYEEWQEFCDTFTSLIHDNTSLSNVQRFHYLRSSLRGEAANMLKTIQISDTAYGVAWTQLKSRYQNERFIIRKHVRALIHLPQVKKDNHTSLRQLINAMSLNLASLKAINRQTDAWDDLLVELVAEKLDTDLHKEWEGETFTKMPTYTELEAFLTKKCNQLEVVNTCRNTEIISKRYKCQVFYNKSVDERMQVVKQKRLCYNCLGSNHVTKDCKSSNCRECNKRHHSLLHINRASTSREEISSAPASVSTVAYSPSTVLLSTCVLLVRDSCGKMKEVRAMLDSGSQANIITTTCAKKLGLQKQKLSTPIIGIGGVESTIKHTTTLCVHSRVSSFNVNVNALIMNEITGKIPNKRIDIRSLILPARVQLADPKYHLPEKVDLLIGACHFYDIINEGRMSMGSLTLINSHFGWIVAGQAPQPNKPLSNSSVTVGFVGINDLVTRFWDIENYKETSFTGEDRKCEQNYQSTLFRKPCGRFVVALPFKMNPKQLGNSSISARNRFFALERRLSKQPETYEAYRDFMREYLQLGHMHPTTGDVMSGYYMPHHCVIKEDSVTTKLRVVFNGSAPSSTGMSLNDVLMVGPTLQDDLFSIMLRMRTKRFIITADITKMYRQVEIRQEDRKYQRIWWRERPEDTLRSYELSTVTYGTAPAAYLAIRTVRELATIEEHNFPTGSKVCLRDFYVDDLITGADTIKQLTVIRDEVTALLNKGGFELKKWASNNPSAFNCFYTDNSDPVTVLTRDFCDSVTTLGTIWNTNCDSLSYKCTPISARVCTKRTVLSDISRIYDPLGLIGPVVITAKVLIQDLWKIKCGWDEPLPAIYLNRWLQYAEQLPDVKNINVPRYVLPLPHEQIELHGFADASEKAFGACLYLVCVKGVEKISARLVCAKSRVAPVKCTTIPRLELCAALLLAELSDRVCTSLDIVFSRRCYYSDSTIVLSWIKSDSRKFKTFVANRVGEIQTLSDPANWYHVATAENPADLISRGLTPVELQQSELWWNGPDFLLKGEVQTCDTFLPIETLPEVKCNIIINKLDEIIPECTSFRKTVRVIAYVIRYINMRMRPTAHRVGPLTVKELEESTTTIIRHLQRRSFKSELDLLMKGGTVRKSSRLTCLNPFLDKDGIIRVGGRLTGSSLPLSRRCPIVLPASNRLTKLIIQDFHEIQLHAGSQGTLAAVRTKYWPLNGRSATRDVVRKCVRCIRQNLISTHRSWGLYLCT